MAKGLGEGRYFFRGERKERFLRLCGDVALASRTSSSTRSFGTVMNFRICSLKCANSGVESNEAVFIWPHSTLPWRSCEVVCRVPVVLDGERL